MSVIQLAKHFCISSLAANPTTASTHTHKHTHIHAHTHTRTHTYTHTQNLNPVQYNECKKKMNIKCTKKKKMEREYAIFLFP